MIQTLAPTTSPLLNPLRNAVLAAPGHLAEPRDTVAPTLVAASPAQDKSVGTAIGRGVAVTAGIVGGAVVAGALAYGTLFAGAQLGSIFANSLWQAPLAQQLAFATFVNGASQALTVAAAAGAVAGGVTAGVATSKDPNPADPPKGSNPFSTAWHAFENQYREGAEKLQKGVQGVGSAQSFGSAISSGAKAGWQVGQATGGMGGLVEGAIGGACLGMMLAGAPFSFGYMSTLPLALAGGMFGMAGGRYIAGGVAGAALGAVGGVAGGVGYGIHKLVGHHDAPAKP